MQISPPIFKKVEECAVNEGLCEATLSEFLDPGNMLMSHFQDLCNKISTVPEYPKDSQV